MDRFNNIPNSEVDDYFDKPLNNNNNDKNREAGYVKNYFEKTSGPNKIIEMSYDVKDPASIQIGQSQQVTFSESFSSDVTYGMKAMIRLGAGIQWSKSSGRSVTVTHQIPAGKTGYVAFKPYYYEVIVNYVTEVPGVTISSKKVSAKTPITLPNGLCDGIEYVVLN